MAWSEVANIRGPQGESADVDLSAYATTAELDDLSSRVDTKVTGDWTIVSSTAPPPSGTPMTTITLIPGV